MKLLLALQSCSAFCDTKEHIMDTNDIQPHLKTRLIPVTKWNEHHQWPPIGGLRHLIFHAKQNGFEKVLRRCGRRVLIDEAAFFAWMEKQNVLR
jgi:hypothetical protein